MCVCFCAQASGVGVPVPGAGRTAVVITVHDALRSLQLCVTSIETNTAASAFALVLVADAQVAGAEKR